MDLKNNPIVNVLDPENPQEVSTKNYVDNSLTYNLTTPFNVQLNGINANLLIVANFSIFNAVALKSSLNTLITSLGGIVSSTFGGTGIYINCVALASTSVSITSISGYINYDAVLYFSYDKPATDTATILNSLYNSNKGVILGCWAVGTYPTDDTYKVVVSKMITSYNQVSSFSGNSSNTLIPPTSNEIILYGITNLNNVMCSQFSPINSATGIGLISGSTYVANYLDDISGKGRRVDLNIQVHSMTGDITTNSNNRFILQALLWASRKINNPTTASTKLNLTNPILPKLQVYNTPSTDYDVVNKLFLTNNYNKFKITLTSTSLISTGIDVFNLSPFIFTSSSVGFTGNDASYYTLINFNCNKATTWANTRYYYIYSGGGSTFSNSSITDSTSALNQINNIQIRITYGILYANSAGWTTNVILQQL